MSRLHAFGELLIDAVPSGTVSSGAFTAPRLALMPGGAPANVAAQIARLGGRSRFLGGVSKDPWGAYLREALVTMGVDTSGLVLRDEPTALAVVQLSATGDRSFRFFRDGTADLAVGLLELDLDGVEAGDVWHVCTNTMVCEPARGVTLAATAEAKRRGALIAVDPNLRPMLWPEGKVATEPVWALLALADWVKVGADEAVTLAGSADAFADRCFACGVKAVVISDGAGPVVCRTPGSAVSQPVPETSVVDTTGAGDALCGGLLYPLLTSRGAHEELAARLDGGPATRDWLRFGAACGALTVSAPGAMPALPDLSAVMKFLG